MKYIKAKTHLKINSKGKVVSSTVSMPTCDPGEVVIAVTINVPENAFKARFETEIIINTEDSEPKFLEATYEVVN